MGNRILGEFWWGWVKVGFDGRIVFGVMYGVV